MSAHEVIGWALAVAASALAVAMSTIAIFLIFAAIRTYREHEPKEASDEEP